ncbi:MFS transporter [Chryseobacterium gleum]|uniref:MFS transporter n=1 Tax=Chryseobacterium gleum TaxID=250 RepID=UPI0028A75889|nr:MFS transporter [Chryseobacterium gleum]
MISTINRKRLFPFAAVTFIYFIVGFLTTVNEQLQAPLKYVFLAEAGGLKNTFVTLVSFFFFLGYLLNGTKASKYVNSLGYKNTIIRGLMFMILGLLMYLISSWIGYKHIDLAFYFKDVKIPLGFLIFILGSFMMGTAACFIQVVVNPYIASYNLSGTTVVQRLNITTAINSIGTTSAPFFVTIIMFSGISIDTIRISQLISPLIFIILAVILVTWTTTKINLPDISNTRSENNEKLTRNIWSFRHFTLGVIAIFFYVGTEVAIGANINLHAFELMEAGTPLTFFGKRDIFIGNLDLGIHALLSTLYWGGFLIGRSVSSFLKNVSAKKQLIFTTTLSIILAMAAMLTQNLWFLAAIGLLHSSMWSCIYSLSISSLNKYTAKASGIFVSAVFGGAVFTLVQGAMADLFGSWRWTWTLTVLCELIILCYSIFGSQVREKDKLA